MVYKLVRRKIELGATAELQTTIDTLYAGGRLTAEEYKELTELLAASLAEGDEQTEES